MLELYYILGVCLFLAYRCCRLNASVIRSNVHLRFIKSFFLSFVWFLELPWELLTGQLFLTQRELDNRQYDKTVKQEIENTINSLKNSALGLSEENEKKMRSRLKERLGDLDSALKDCEYFSKSITKNNLAGLIAYTFSKSDADKTELIERYETITPVEFVEKCVWNLPNLTDAIKKDLMFLNLSDEHRSIYYNSKSPFEDLLGFHTLGSGLTFYGVEVKTKETLPFFMIIYYDGKELRAHVPPHNFYNKETIEPFGVDENADLVFLEEVLKEDCFKSTMYKQYAEGVITDISKDQIFTTVNYSPVKGVESHYNWDDINIEEMS